MASSDNLRLTDLQHSQIAVVLSLDNSPFETLISHLMSAVNDQRSQAETVFNLCKKHHPDTLVIKLSHLLHSSPHDEARAMSAVLLRRILTVAGDDETQSPRLYTLLLPTTQFTLKSTLLDSVSKEMSKSISKKLCDTVSELASLILPDNGWTELLPFMFQCVTSGNNRHKESALLIFAQLAHYIGETLIPHLNGETRDS